MACLDPHLIRPTRGFMGVPATLELSDARAAILGMPFDCGADPYRIGARHGPGAIRDQAIRLHGPWPGFSMTDPLEELRLIDCGDAAVTSGCIEEAYEVMEAAIGQIADIYGLALRVSNNRMLRPSKVTETVSFSTSVSPATYSVALAVTV